MPVRNETQRAPMQSRAAATRAAVLRAAAEVFEQHGFGAATISQILDQADVTKGALYFHFDSKESLAQAIIAEQSNWREVNTEESVCATQRMIDLSHRFVQALQTDPLVRASIRLTLERNTFATEDPGPYVGWVDAITEILTEARSGKDLLPHCDPAEVAGVVTAGVTGLQLLSEATSGRRDLSQRLVSFWSIVLPGIARPAVIRALVLEGTAAASLVPA